MTRRQAGRSGRLGRGLRLPLIGGDDHDGAMRQAQAIARHWPEGGCLPEPRATLVAPRTSISASAARSSSAWTGSSWASLVVRRPGGRWGRASSAAAASIAAAAAQRSSSPRHPRRRGVRCAQPGVTIPGADEADGGVTQPRLPYRPAHGGHRGGRSVDADHDLATGLGACHSLLPSRARSGSVHLPLLFSPATRVTDRGIGPEYPVRPAPGDGCCSRCRRARSPSAGPGAPHRRAACSAG